MLNLLTAFDKQQTKAHAASENLPKPALVFDPEWAPFCEARACEATATSKDANVPSSFSDNEIAFLPKLLPEILALWDPIQTAYVAAIAWLKTHKADSAHLTQD